MHHRSAAVMAFAGWFTLGRGSRARAGTMSRLATAVVLVAASLGTFTLGQPVSAAPSPSLLIADLRNYRLLITDFDGRVLWKFDNPTGRTTGSRGPLGVRWMPNNQILATFGTGEVGLIDVATKKWAWKTSGYNGDWFQSPYDAEILPDGNLAVATRFNEGGRIVVYNRSTGAVVWKHLLSNAHSVRYLTAEQSFDHTYPTLLVGGWGAIREVAYRPNGGQNVTWSAKTEYTHDALLVETDKILTTEGYYIQKIDQWANQLWRKSTPQENRRVAVNPNGGYIYSVGEGDRIEFRDTNGDFLRSWTQVSDGTHLDYPYGIQVVDYAGPNPPPTASPTATPTPRPSSTPAPSPTVGPSATPHPSPSPTPPQSGTVLFADGFESGTFGSWTSVRTAAGASATVQSMVRRSGSYAATFSSTGTTGAYAYARRSLDSVRSNLTVGGGFIVTREGASGSNVPFVRLFSASGARLVSLYRQNLASGRVYVSYGGAYLLTSGRLPLDTWGHLSLRVVVNGAASSVEVRLDGAIIHQASAANLGTSGVFSVQIGNEAASQTFTVTADDISVTP